MHRLRPAGFGSRCQVRFNSSSSTPRKPRVVAELGGITIPSRDELKQQTPLPDFKPDLSYLKHAPGSVAARIAQVEPTPAPEIVEKAKRSAKLRREHRLAREREAANARETAAASALDALIGQAEYTKMQLAPSGGIQTPLAKAKADMKLANTSAETFEALVEHALHTPSQPDRVSTPKVTPGSRAAAAAKARREARLRQEASAPPEETEDRRSRPNRRRRDRRRPREDEFDMSQFADIEAELEAELGENEELLELSPEDLEWVPLESHPDHVGPVPVSETLMEVLHPTAEQPGVVDPRTNNTHPISTGLVSSFVTTDYSSYVPKKNTYKDTPLKTGVLQYARQALARNPSIALAQRTHALGVMERAMGGKQ